MGDEISRYMAKYQIAIGNGVFSRVQKVLLFSNHDVRPFLYVRLPELVDPDKVKQLRMEDESDGS